MKLTPEEIERYKRHLVLHDVGGQGQQKLKESKVLVVGAGGLGSPLLMYLAAAGVGTIGIIDDDHVSLDNLQRQVIHDTDQIGAPKTESAAESISRLNPHVKVQPHTERLTARNALDIISSYDIVADGSDNFATRYLTNDACFFAKRPLVFAALGPFDGYLTTFRAFEKRRGWQAVPQLSMYFSRSSSAGDGCELLGGGRSRRHCGCDGNAAGDRGAEGTDRRWRIDGRPSSDL